MNDILMRFLTVSSYVRWASLASIILLNCILLEIIGIEPKKSLRQRLLLELSEQQEKYQQQIHIAAQKIKRIRSLEKEQQLAQSYRQQVVQIPLSVETLITQSGGKLESWKPNLLNREFTLLLSWSQLQKLFAYFSDQYAFIKILRFRIQPEREALHARFLLEITDENFSL